MRMLPACLTVAGLCASAYAQSQFEPIPLPPGANPSSLTITSISADGSAALGTYFENNVGTLIRWTQSAGTVVLPLSPQATNTIPAGLSGDGSVAVGFWVTPDFGCYWDATDTLQVSPAPPGAGNGGYRLEGISNDGLTFLGWNPFGSFAAYLWTATGGYMELTGAPSNPGFVSPSEISGDGTTVVGTLLSNQLISEAFYWNDQDGVVKIGFLDPLDPESLGVGVSQDGTTVVGRSRFEDRVEAFRWTADEGMVGLGHIGRGTSFGSLAYDASGDGRIVVGQSVSGSLGTRAFVYTEELGMVVLEDLLEATGDTGSAGWVLSVARGISDDGRVIVGTGFNPSGTPQGWRAQLPPLETIGTTYCDPAELNSTGLDGRLEIRGSSYLAMNDVTLEATQLPANVFGYFLIGTEMDFLPMVGGGQGNVCIGGAIGRFLRPEFDEVQNSGSAGAFSLRIDVTNVPTPMGPSSLQVGDIRTFQCWYRDQNPGTTSNLTTAVEATFQ